MRLVASFLVLALAGCSFAEVRLASLFQSGMVFQQRTEAPVWGTAKPGERISVRTTWGANAVTTAREDGTWSLKLKTPAAGGPFEVSVSGENALWLRNVMVGEVWVCSGQSNMEWPLGIHPGMTQVANAAEEVAGATYPAIRLFQVERKMADTIQTSCGGAWKACTPETVRSFSAVAYFFGRELHKQLGVPVGLIMAAWGGTEVELWTSESALKRIPELGEALERNRAARAAYNAAMAERQAKLKSDPLHGAEAEGYDDTSWTRVADPGSFEQMGLGQFDGSVWFRCRLLLTDAQAKTAATLTLGPIDDADEVWINGQHIGGTANHQVDRAYGIPAGVLKEGFNTVVIRALDTGGVGGFQRPGDIGLRVGESRIPLTNWRYKVGIDLSAVPMPTNAGRAASTLYNGMIAPLIPFAIRGAIWYQGESNVSRAHQYRTSFPNMIRNWREDWGLGDFPFYFVQIAPYAYNAKDASAELREAQTLTAQTLKNTGQAITMDLVPDVRDIHPPRKQEVGDRLARLALNLTYGMKSVPCFGPTYASHRVSGKEVRVKFAHAEGLEIRGDSLAGIEICGEDKVFVPAQAKVDGDSLVVWAEGIDKPVAVRFGWRDAVVTNLYNGAGLPAGPFRTDNWPGVTEGVKW